LALALGEALGMSVEALFGAESQLPLVRASAIGPLGSPGSRVALATLPTGLVALGGIGDVATRSGFTIASGIVGDEPGTVRPLEPLRPTVVVAGCDPALGLLEVPLAHRVPPVGFAWRSCGISEALDLAKRGLVHAAGVHAKDSADGASNIAIVAERLGSPSAHHSDNGPSSGDNGPSDDIGPSSGERGALTVGFARWRQGLLIRPELEATVGNIADAARIGLRLVNRERGAAARTLLESTAESAGVNLTAMAGYESEVHGHLEVASAIAAGLGDIGVASEPAALAYGLGFLPLSEERFDLAIPPGLADTLEVKALLEVLTSPWLRTQLNHLAGYDASSCGELLDTSEPPSSADLGDTID